MTWKFLVLDGIETASAPDNVARSLIAMESLPLGVVQHRYVKRDDDGGIFHVDGLVDSAPDIVGRYLTAVLENNPIASTEFMLYSIYNYATSSQRPQKSGLHVRPKTPSRNLEALLLELLAMQVLAATSRGTDFASPSSFADITGLTLSFSLAAATTVVLGFAAKNILYSDTMASEAQIGFNVDGTDYVVGEFKGHSLGSNSYKAAAGFIYPIALAAGSHSITPRVKTVDGMTVGNLAGGMAFVAIG